METQRGFIFDLNNRRKSTGCADAAISKLGFGIAELPSKAVALGIPFALLLSLIQDIAWKFWKTFRNFMGNATKALERFPSVRACPF